MIHIPNDLAPNRVSRVFAGVVAIFSAFGLAYFGLTGVIDPGSLVPGGDTEAARAFASYLVPRNLVLGGAGLVFLALRSWRSLSLLLILNGLVQMLDAGLGLSSHEASRTIGPAVIAVALFAAAAGLLRSSSTAAPATSAGQS